MNHGNKLTNKKNRRNHKCPKYVKRHDFASTCSVKAKRQQSHQRSFQTFQSR